MSDYLVVCWQDAEPFTEVWDEVLAIQNLRVGGEFTLEEALRFLDKVDRERYSKLAPRTWIWRLHQGEEQ